VPLQASIFAPGINMEMQMMLSLRECYKEIADGERKEWAYYDHKYSRTDLKLPCDREKFGEKYRWDSADAAFIVK
jgi:hypothetical protein